jgi:photosystem II stability/assembly factor-like uncharacterized protein
MEWLYIAASGGVGAFKRTNNHWQEANWRALDPEVTSISAGGGHVFAGTVDGVFRSDDQGNSWEPMNDGLTLPHIRWLAQHPAEPTRILAGTEPAGIFVSSDKGRSWTGHERIAELRDTYGWYLPYSPEAGCVRGFALHGDRAYGAVEQGGLLRSDDRGDSWRLVEGATGDPNAEIPAGHIQLDVHSVDVHVSSPDLVFAPTGGGLYRSENGGDTWTELYDCYCRAVWDDPEDPDHLIFGPADGVDRRGRIEETHDGGMSWSGVNEGTDAPWSHHMVERFLQVDDDLLAVLSNGELLATSLSELRWERILPQIDDVQAIAIAVNGG